MFIKYLYTFLILWEILPKTPSLPSLDTFEIVELVPTYYLLILSPYSAQKPFNLFIIGLVVSENANPSFKHFAPNVSSILYPTDDNIF